MATETPEIIAGLRIDGQGLKTATNELEKHDSLFKSMLGSVDRMGSSLAKTVLGFAGVYGVGQIINQYARLGDQGSALANMAGRVTGGANTYLPYSSALLKVQSATGVSAQATAQGLIAAIQTVGGRPTPQQAAMVGGLLAGYGQAVGLTPAQVSQIVAPILLSTGRDLGSTGQVEATLMAGLSAFPGSQAGPALSVVSGNVAALSIGANRAVNPSMVAQSAGIVNALAQANPAVFGHGNVVNQHQALGAIGTSLGNAYLNPSMEAFLTMGGLSYEEQRQAAAGGVTPSILLKIGAQANRMYPDPQTRDMALRSMFGGILPADAIESLMTPAGQRALQQAVAGGKGASVGELKHILSNLQAQSAPGAVANKVAGKALTLIPAVGATVLKPTTGGAAGVGGILSRLAGMGTSFGAGIGAVAGLLINPDEFDKLNKALGIDGGPLTGPPTGKRLDGMMTLQRTMAVAAVLKAGLAHGHGKLDEKTVEWMQQQINNNNLLPNPTGHGGKVYASGELHTGDTIQHQFGPTMALFERVLKQLTAPGVNSDDAFKTAVKQFASAVDKLTHGKGSFSTTAFLSPGGGADATPRAMLVSAVTSTPGNVYAALIGAYSPGSPTANAALVSAALPAGSQPGGGGSIGGTIPASWEQATRHYSDNGYGVAYLNGLLPGPKQGHVKGDTKIVASAAASAGIPGALLWAVYGAESSWGKASNWFGLVAVPRTGSFAGDAAASAHTLATLYRESGHSTAKQSSGGGGHAGRATTASAKPHSGMVMSALLRGGGGGGGAGSSQHQTVVNVHLDGRTIDQYRRLTRGSA